MKRVIFSTQYVLKNFTANGKDDDYNPLFWNGNQWEVCMNLDLDKILYYKYYDIKLTDEDIKIGDSIIDTEKLGIFMNGEPLFNIVKCKEIISEDDLIWESKDLVSSACDNIYIFKKVIE